MPTPHLSSCEPGHPERWATVVVRVDPADVDLVSGLLWDAGVAGVEERTVGAEAELRAGVDAQQADVVAAAVDGRGRTSVEVVSCEDDLECWRQYARSWRAGSRLVVVPSWQDPPPWVGVDDVVLRIDPGRAFGSGAHATTRMCLAELERLVEPSAAVADVGCGSGVLAVAAARLGAAVAVAVDVDPEAVRATGENAARNGVLEQVEASATAVGDLEDHAYDVVVANIGRGTLVQMAGDLARAAADGGTLLLSGVLEGQVADVLAAFAAVGFSLAGTVADDEWRTLVLRRA
jgi:ribosomal protein L11 methyltransferase